MWQYARVLFICARNSLVRDMSFRTNFVLETISSLSWVFMNLGFYVLIFRYAPEIGKGTGWGQYQFFLFIATGLLINSTVQAVFMINAEEFTEAVRTGALDFVLVRPIDTQFLVSVRRFDWSALGNLLLGIALGVYSLGKLGHVPTFVQTLLYLLYVACGIAIYYSLMIALAAATVWMGRNLTVLDFWFYITIFARYPMEIYTGPVGGILRWAFTFIIPVLIVVNVPARLLVRPLLPQSGGDLLLPLFALLATAACLGGSRWLFQRALESYRSASS